MIEQREGRWRVRVYSHGRVIASRTFDRRRDAETWERGQKTSLALGTWTDPRLSLTTVGEYLDTTWKQSRPKVQPSTLAREASLSVIVKESFGRRPLAAVSPSEVSAFARRLGKTYSASTVRQAVGLLRKVFAMAVADGVVPKNPTAGVRLPRVARSEPRPLTHAEVARLVAGMGDRDRLLTLVMAYGGLRWGEAAALRRSSLTGYGLRLTESLAEANGRTYLSDLKTHQARSVPLPPSVLEQLRHHAGDLASDAWLFPSKSGTPLQNRNWRRDVLTPAAKGAGLAPVAPHNLRDTAASLAIAAGATVPAVARLLGHEDGGAIALRHYAGIYGDDLSAVAEKMERGLLRATRELS